MHKTTLHRNKPRGLSNNSVPNAEDVKSVVSPSLPHKKKEEEAILKERKATTHIIIKVSEKNKKDMTVQAELNKVTQIGAVRKSLETDTVTLDRINGIGFLQMPIGEEFSIPEFTFLDGILRSSKEEEQLVVTAKISGEAINGTCSYSISV